MYLTGLLITIILQFANAQNQPNRDYIVVMKDDVTTGQMHRAMQTMHQMSAPINDEGIITQSVNILKQTNQLINTITGPMSEDAVAMARNMPEVSYVELDQIATRADAVIDIEPPTEYTNYAFTTDGSEDAAFSASSTATNTDRYNLDIIDEPCFHCRNGLYNPEATGLGVHVFVLDTGINYGHSEFAGRARFSGFDAIDESRNTNQRGVDCHGHGTHVSGIAAGVISGVAKEASVFGVRVLDCNSFGGFGGIIRALDFVLRRHRENLGRSGYKGAVVSMSLAGPVVQAANEAVCRLVRAGVVVVTASGNFRRDACNYSPGSAGCHINVGAHFYTERDTDSCVKDVYWFTSRTTSPGSNYGRCVHMMAPGQYVVSASYLDRNRFVSMSGTSMACPHVAGAAALILDLFPGMHPDRVRRMLLGDSCSDIDERRMHPSLRGLTPNRRLRVLKSSGVINPPTTTPTTTQPPTTTPRPQICDTICPFDTLKNARIEANIVVTYEIRNEQTLSLEIFLQLNNRLKFNNKRQVLNKLSITSQGGTTTYAMIFRQIRDISSYAYIYGGRKQGIRYQDIDKEISLLSRVRRRRYFPQTIIPVGNNRVFVLASSLWVCNNNEYRQANYTTYPEAILNPFTIDNLLGTKASFDITFTPNFEQVYVHNTRNTFSLNCECYNYYNIEVEQLSTVSEALGGDRNLIITDMDAYYARGRLYFTVTLCMPACYTASPCVNKVVNNMVFAGLTKDGLNRVVLGSDILGMEIISVAPYVLGGVTKFAVSLVTME